MKRPPPQEASATTKRSLSTNQGYALCSSPFSGNRLTGPHPHHSCPSAEFAGSDQAISSKLRAAAIRVAPMWGGFALLVLVAAAQITVTQAQKNSDDAAPRCKDVRMLLSSTDSITLDADALASVGGGLQHVLDCVPERAAVQFDLSELELNDTLKIERSVSIEGSRVSILCLDDNTQPIIAIRSNDVLLGGFNFVGCNLNSTSGLIQVKGAENVTLTDMVFESIVNTNGPSCLLAINSTIEIQNATAKNNRGVYGGAMSFVRGSEVVVVDSSFESNNATQQGGALYIQNSELFLSKSRFIENLAFDYGGAIFVASFPNIANLEVRSTVFERNSAGGDSSFGGAMAFLGNGTSGKLDNVTFLDNSAEGGSRGRGGAIYGKGIRSIKILRSIFDKNKVVERKADDGQQKDFFDGGAVALSKIPEILVKKSTFTDNHAEAFGGAISVDAKSFVVQGVNISDASIVDCTFDGNSAVGDSPANDGGALSFFGDGLRAIIKGSNFTKNEATGLGGAVNVAEIASLKISHSNFTKNEAAGFGGAVAVYGSSIASLEIFHCSFYENKVVKSKDNSDFETSASGGGIFFRLTSEAVIINSTFIRNVAPVGGGMHAMKTKFLKIGGSSFQDNVGITGGAIAFTATNATIEKSNFTRNTAISVGGAIESGYSSIMVEEKLHIELKEVEVKDNRAGDAGGGIRLVGVDLEMEDSLWQGNSARDTGGAVHLIQVIGISPIATIKATKFIGNGADVGGGVYVQNGDVSLSDCAFEANIADFKGGALFCEDLSSNLIVANKDSVVTVHSSNFTGNKAGEGFKQSSGAGVDSANGKGGAVSISGLGLVSAFQDCNFSKNLALSGGAMHIQDVRIMTLEDSTFLNGEALTGGALTIINTGIIVNNGIFVGNAARLGGAVSFTQVGSLRFFANPTLVASFQEVQFVENVAMEGSGAIDLREMSLICNSCLFDSNSAGIGGNEIGSGGAIRALPASNLTLLNSSVINCRASQSGGGIYLEDAIFRGENLTIGNNTAIENGGGFAIRFAGNRLIPWRCTSCSIQGNRAKNGGGLHVSAGKTTQPNCQALRNTFLSGNLLPDCERSLKKSNLPEAQVRLDKAVFGGNHAEDSGSDIFLRNFKNSVCCDDECWSEASALDEGVERCGLGEPSRRNGENPAPLGTIFESMSISPSEVPNHASDQELPAIKITPLDSFGQVAMDNVTLRVEVATSGGELFGSPVTSEGVLMRGPTTVTGVFMRALPDSYNLSFKLTSQDGKRIVTELLAVDVRECVIGEVSRDKGLRCDRCPDDFFSFDVTDENCTPCPVEKAKCSGGRLVPLDGFWHSGPRSSRIHACLTEEACTYPNRTNALFASKLNSPGDDPQCAQGYSDLLCGSCDTSHGKSRFKCTECQGGVPAGLALGGVMLALAVLSLIYVRNATAYSEGVLGKQSNGKSASSTVPSRSQGGFDLPAFIVGEILDQEVQSPCDNVQPKAPQQKTRYPDIFKILVNFFQVTGSAAAINVGWTRSMLMLFTFWDITSGVADSNNFFSLECAFSSRKNSLPRSIQTSIFLAFVPFMVWAVLVTVHYGHASGGKKSFKDIKLWSCVALLAVQQASYISVTRTLVRIFYCVDVSPVEGLFWVQDTSVRCYTGSHAFLVGFVGAPGLLLISIGFPGWLLFKLTRSRENLEQDQVVRLYGFLYEPYKKNAAAWEVVIFLRKAFLAAVVVFGRALGEGIQTNLALFIMVGSIVLQTQFQPFLESKLNFLELGSLVISTLAFIIGNLVDQPEMTHGGRVSMSVIFIGTAGIYITYMLKQIFDGVFVELRETMEKSNSGCSLPTGNSKLLMTAVKMGAKKTNTTLKKKWEAFVKRFFS
ncbi:hypothetical protein BSKO_06852 [Bryopsis sp. KO-2023]|nr:hypothetical protein BSKO_06852 [Bryopsis sp. KO-2023]